MQQLFLLYFFGLNVKARDVIIRHEQGKAAVQRKPIVFQSGFQYGHGFAGRAAAGADGKGVRILGETKLQLFDKIGYDSGWGPCIDIMLLDDRAIQRVLRDVDNNDLAVALKGANEDVQNTIFKNLSKRLAAMIKEDMEFMGPVRMKDVEEAQQKIVGVIRKLEDSAEIVISRGGGDEIVV